MEIESTVLTLIDVQEKLYPHMRDKETLLKNIVTLTKGFRILDIPIIVNEQYKKGLGETLPEIKEAVGKHRGHEKISFSCCKNDEAMVNIERLHRKSVVVAGIESHICVLQSAIDFKNNGYEVYVVADCISSRKSSDTEIALQRMMQEGIKLTSYESLLFELLQSSEHASFKEISKLIK